MFYVDVNEGEDGEEDEIDKSIKEIHQSAQKLSTANCNTSFPPVAPSLHPGELLILT